MIRNLIFLTLLVVAWSAAQSPAGNAENGKKQFVKLGCYLPRLSRPGRRSRRETRSEADRRRSFDCVRPSSFR